MNSKFSQQLVLLLALTGSLVWAGPKEDFFRAVHSDNASSVRTLIERGFDPNTYDEHGQTGLLLAIREPSVRVVQVLLDAPETDVNATNGKDESALMMASLKGDKALVEKLLTRDAAVNKPGWTPLHYAATNGHLDIMRLLLDNYAFIDAESPNGTTPLMMAAGYGSAEAVQLLLDEGADPMMRNQKNMSAADFALRAQRPEIAKQLTAAMQARRVNRGQW